MKAYAFAQMLEILGPYDSEPAIAVSTLCETLKSAPPTTTLAAASAKIATAVAGHALAAPDEAAISGLLPALSRLAQIIQLIGTKADSAAADIMFKSLADNYAAPINVVRAAFNKKPPAKAQPKAPKLPNAETISRYTASLSAHAPGTAEYGQALETLSADNTAKAAEMREIAQRLGHTVTASAARAASLKAISRSHKNIVETIAKIEAMKGQTAT